MNVKLNKNQIRLIKEARGVSETSIAYVNFLYTILEPKVIEMVAGMENDLDEFYIESEEIIKSLRGNREVFFDLPIETFEIDLNFKVTKKTPETNSPFVTGGGAYMIESSEGSGSFVKEPSDDLPVKILEEVDKTIHAKLDFEIYITPLFEENNLNELLYDLRDTITHELNHMYEFYKRWENTGVGKTPLTKSFAGGKNVNTPKKIFQVYIKFLDYMYYSEPWEINANIQEAYSKLLRMSWDEFKKTKQYNVAENMENFSADDLYNELVMVAKEKNPETVLYHVKNLHKFYLKQYLKFSKNERADEISDEAELLKDDVFKTKNLLELFKKFEGRIQNAGRKLKRNYARLLTIEK